MAKDSLNGSKSVQNYVLNPKSDSKIQIPGTKKSQGGKRGK